MRELEESLAHEGDRGQTGEEVKEHDKKNKKLFTWHTDMKINKVVDDKRVRHDRECLARQISTQVLPDAG